MIQLNPPLPFITPKGKAIAHFMIDSGIENHIQWVCFQDSTGECWTWQNPDIRIQRNITLGRNHVSPFYNPDDVNLNNNGKYQEDEYNFIDQDHHIKELKKENLSLFEIIESLQRENYERKREQNELAKTDEV